MTVIEAVDDPAHAPGTVVEETRPGYTWKGKVLQYAEVRAVRARPGS
jgi:molecular chaperone GrpE (heat shock protein)